MNLKVGFVTPYFYPYVGGVQKCVLRITQNLMELDCTVSIITSDYAPTWSSHDLSNEKFDLKRLKCVGRIAEVPLVPSICREIGNSDVDILHINGMYPMFTDVAIFEASKIRKPMVLNYHFDPATFVPYLSPFTKIYSKLAPFSIRKANAVVATGESYAKSSPILSSRLRDIRFIPNAVEDHFFIFPSDLSLFRLKNELNISDDEKIILFVGQLKRFKGIDVLINAFKIVNSKVRCKLLIVGKGPEEIALRILASKLGISKKVVFAGYVDDADLPLYYHLCDVYVLPSVQRIENFGISLLEAMASGKPVISSDLPGPNELVENRVNGLLFKPYDFRFLASLLLELLANEEIAANMGAAGKFKALDYSWKKVALKFLKLYESILR
jgi:glycosyltransferase involved in cell wall biosynthesis